jgi:hypothetical protein
MSLPGLLLAGQDRGVPVEREGSLLASFSADREKGSEAVSPAAIVWPCPLAVDAYAAAGRDVGFPARPARRVLGRWCPGRVLALCPGGGPLPEDLRAPAAVRAPEPGPRCDMQNWDSMSATARRRRQRLLSRARGATCRTGTACRPRAAPGKRLLSRVRGATRRSGRSVSDRFRRQRP